MRKKVSLVLLGSLLLNACASNGSEHSRTPSAKKAQSQDGPGKWQLAVKAPAQQVKKLPKSRYGNPRQYKVNGKTYRVMDSAEGYYERGIASWYGKKFHGRLTSSREVYDMHQLTAAHKSLPIPTYVQVTNLKNGREVIVKVNDRGPFHDQRVIDLSYAAAVKLDMIKKGTAPVAVRVLEAGSPNANTTVVAKQVDVNEFSARKATKQEVIPFQVQRKSRVASSNRVSKPAATYLQLGAYSRRKNAEQMRQKVLGVIPSAVINIDPHETRPMYLVKLGPVYAEPLVEELAQELDQAGIKYYRLDYH